MDKLLKIRKALWALNLQGITIFLLTTQPADLPAEEPSKEPNEAAVSVNFPDSVAPATSMAEKEVAPFPEATAIPLGWLYSQLKGTEANPQLLINVVEIQNLYPTTILNRKDFLEFYRDVLSLCSKKRTDPTFLIEKTYPFLLTLGLSYEEVLNIAFAALPKPESRAGLWPTERRSLDHLGNPRETPLEKFQGLILVRLLENQAPESAQKLLDLTKLHPPTAAEVIAKLFPSFAVKKESETLRNFQLCLYKAAIRLINEPDSLIGFYTATANYLSSLNPTASEIKEIAGYIKVHNPGLVIEAKNNWGTHEELHDGNDPLCVIEFLKFHLQTHQLLTPDQFIQLSEIYKCTLNSSWSKLSPILNGGNPEHQKVSDRYESLNDFVSNENLLRTLLLLSPAVIHKENVSSVTAISAHMPKLGASVDKIIEYQTNAMRQASDPESVAAIFYLNPTAFYTEASKRFSHFASQTITAQQFVSLILEATKHNYWDDPLEFSLFLSQELPRFFSMSPEPTFEELLTLHGAIRHRPVENVRTVLERKIAEKVMVVPQEDVISATEKKRHFLNFAINELNASFIGKQQLDLNDPTDRILFRERLVAILEPALTSYYPGNPGQTGVAAAQRVHLFADLLLHEDLEDPASIARLLLVIGDELESSTIALLESAILTAPFWKGFKSHLIRALRDKLAHPSDLQLSKMVSLLLDPSTAVTETELTNVEIPLSGLQRTLSFFRCDQLIEWIANRRGES